MWRLADADRLTVHESEEGEHRAGQREARSLAKCAVDDKSRNRAEHEAPKYGATAHDREPFIEHAHLRKLVDAYRRNAGAGRAERIVDHQLACPPQIFELSVFPSGSR